jgi:hypothetical protein
MLTRSAASANVPVTPMAVRMRSVTRQGVIPDKTPSAVDASRATGRCGIPLENRGGDLLSIGVGQCDGLFLPADEDEDQSENGREDGDVFIDLEAREVELCGIVSHGFENRAGEPVPEEVEADRLAAGEGLSVFLCNWLAAS